MLPRDDRMPRILVILVLTLLAPHPAGATFTMFQASGSLTRLDQTTFHLHIGGGLWSDDPLLHASYPIGAYTVNSDYELTGPFGTPMNPEGGMYYDLAQNYAHAGFVTWRYAGLDWF